MKPSHPPNPVPLEKVVYRHLALPVSTFDHLKDTQRAHEARTGERLSIAQTVALVSSEHKRLTQAGSTPNTAAPGVGNHDQANRRIPAILR